MLMIIVFIVLYFIRYYEGSLPVVVTSDPEIIKEVFVKQFNNFYGRRVSTFPCLNQSLSKSVNMFIHFHLESGRECNHWTFLQTCKISYILWITNVCGSTHMIITIAICGNAPILVPHTFYKCHLARPGINGHISKICLLIAEWRKLLGWLVKWSIHLLKYARTSSLKQLSRS